MKFEDAAAKIANVTDLRRVAKAHVVDHRQLSNEQLAGAVIKSKPQYIHEETIAKGIEQVLRREPQEDVRALAYVFLVDVLLEQYDSQLPVEETDERVIGFEQRIVDRSNETDLATLACGDKTTKRHQDLELYKFILGVAWEHQDTVSPDEANLLFKLRLRLRVNETEHRILEAHLGRYPRPRNETHNRADVADIRKRFQEMGLLFPVRAEDGVDRDVIPEEIAAVLRPLLGVQPRREAYLELLDHRALKKKAHLTEILESNQVTFSKYDNVEQLKERIVSNVPLEQHKGQLKESPGGLTVRALLAGSHRHGTIGLAEGVAHVLLLGE